MERSRTGAIELISPMSVRVHEQVERDEDTKQYYQKVLVRKTAKPRDYPYSDTYLKILLSTAILPLFTRDFWVQGSYRGTNAGTNRTNALSGKTAASFFSTISSKTGTRTSSEQQKHDRLSHCFAVHERLL